MKRLILFFEVLFCTISFSFAQSETTVVEDTSFLHSWQTIVEYESGQDYIKNLDFSLLDEKDIPKNIRNLLIILQDIFNGDYDRALKKILKAEKKEDSENLKTLLGLLAKELLDFRFEYSVIEEKFPQLSDDRVRFFSKFPSPDSRVVSTAVSDSLRFSMFGQPEIQIQVNDAPVWAWFDTGAEITVMSESMAERIGISYNSTDSILVGTVTDQNLYSRVCSLDSIYVGNVKLYNHPVMIFPDDNLTFGVDTMNTKVDFILGWTAIQELSATLDGQQMRYSATIEQRKVERKNFFWLGYAALKCNSTDGQSLIFGLDTGLDDTEFKPNIKLKANLGPITMDSIYVGGAAGIQAYQAETVDKFDVLLSGHRITLYAAMIAENIDMFFISQDGTIGADIIPGNIIVIDFPNGIFEIKQ